MKQLVYIIKIFITPVKVFEKTRKENKWLLPFLIIILVSFFCCYFLVSNLIIPANIEKTVNEQNLPEEIKQARLGYLHSSYHFVSSLIAETGTRVLYYPILAFFISIIPLGFGGQKVQYTKVFSGLVHIGIINSLGLIFNSGFQLLTNDLSRELNLALFFQNFSGFIYFLMRVISLFEIWQLILLITLFSIYFNYKRKKSFLIVFSFWFLWNMVSAYFLYLKSFY